jgi:hypothetical protein
MVWAQRILLAFIMLILAGPASAAIERFSDDKGVIHITNTGEEKPRPPEPEEEISPAPPGTSETPPSKEPEQPEQPPEAEEPPKPSSYLTVRQGVIQISNVPRRQNALAQAPPAPQAPARLPGRRSIIEPSETALFSLASAGAKVGYVQARVPAGSPGTPVSKYKDSQGVLHISNASPDRRFNGNSMVAGWSSSPAAPKTLAALPAAAESESTQSLLTRGAAPDIPIQRVAFTSLGSDDAFPMPPFSLASASASGSRTSSKVRRFRDGNGIIHIVGRGPARANSLQAGSPLPDRTIATPRLPFPSASGLRGTYPDPKASGLLPPGRKESTVLMRKNKQGALVIGNAPARPLLNVDKEEVRSRLEPILTEAASLAGLPVSLLEAVIRVESNFQPAAVSPKGAMGLMQLMPGTAKFLQVEDPFCPRENILGGARYLRLLLDFFGQSLPLALAAYNAGFQRVIDAGYQIPAIKETRDFVTQVLGQYYLREKQRYFNKRFIL